MQLGEGSGRSHARAGPAPSWSCAANSVHTRSGSPEVRHRVRRAGGRAGGQRGRARSGAACSHYGEARHARAAMPCYSPGSIAATSTESGASSVCATHGAGLWRAVCEEREPGQLELGAREPHALRSAVSVAACDCQAGPVRAAHRAGRAGRVCDATRRAAEGR